MFTAEVENVQPGTRYLLRLDDGRELPDPASRFQPEGADGPSEVTDDGFDWAAGYWVGLPLQDLILYELHTGVFTPEGTLDAAVGRLRELKELGFTGLSLMPVAQFAGDRGWGFETTHPFAVHHAYGGPAQLRRFVDACHSEGLAVVLDADLSRPGRAGALLEPFAPYTAPPSADGDGPFYNLDGPDSDEVRGFLLRSALRWIKEFRVDGLRLAEAHRLRAPGPLTFLEELVSAAHSHAGETHRLIYVLADNELNDPRLLRPPELGGFGLDALWADDFHCSLHASLSGERFGPYQDFGRLGDLAKASEKGIVLAGERSDFRKRRHGGPLKDTPDRRLSVCAESGTTIGRRPRGERLASLIPFEAQKLAAGVLLLSPFLPRIFMGQEYGETAPFLLFADDSVELELLRGRRRRDQEACGWPAAQTPPEDPKTFAQCGLDPARKEPRANRALLALHRELMRLRKSHPALAGGETRAKALEKDNVLLLTRTAGDAGIFAAFNLGDLGAAARLPVPEGTWRRLLDSADARWEGKGAASPAELGVSEYAEVTLKPHSFVLYEQAPRD